MKDCPQCGKALDLEKEGITISEKDAKKVSKPVIRREVKRKIEELVPPERSYFAYIPSVSPEKDINKFVSKYYDKHDLGKTSLNKELKNVDMFISKEAARKMLDHCYEHGRKKEVMGLILGETYQYNNKLFSIAKDIATSELDATEVNVRFDSFDKLFEELEQLKYDYQILGWYHSHPNYTCFMSSTDVETQARMFKQDYQRAIVIDPIKMDMKAFALDQATKNKVDESGYAIIDFKD
jgi:proteasome lid subunit RPN8/RPN11